MLVGQISTFYSVNQIYQGLLNLGFTHVFEVEQPIQLLIDSIQNLDHPVVLAYLLTVAVIFVFINLLVDLIYTFIDPRVRVH